MGRSIAACFACIAMMFTITCGAWKGYAVEPILIRCLFVMSVYACLGWVVGQTADYMIRQSLETNFRTKIAKIREERAGKS